MTNEQKDLLYKDLCTRLSYGVKVKIKYYDDVWKLLAIYTNGTTYVTKDIDHPIETYFEDCKPYLFPLSSMTEEQKNELIILRTYVSLNKNKEYLLFDWLNANHFDYRDLIPMGLAIDATNLNIY